MCFRNSILLALILSWPCVADESFYLSTVKPVLRERCYACHGALKQEAGLRLDTVESILSGGDSGSAVSKESVESSLILDRISAESKDERMPPEGASLTKAQISAIRQWISDGAIAPKNEVADDDPKNHWAFQKPIATPIPKSQSSKLNPIDAFLSAKREAKGIQAIGKANRNLLLRRLYLDLVGFPPNANELREFLSNDHEDAYESVVDRLLASPHYGERWGRHWMDIWRYSDWYGLGAQLRDSQKHIWHWRDWIVESLNDDKGYDRMIVEMLAADELNPTNQRSLRATGFLARNYYLFNRTTWLDNTIEHTNKAFLGLTVNCAKCHDHKYDPITHEDYYRMRAIFEPHQIRLDPIAGETDLEKNGLPRSFDAHPDAMTYVHLRGNEKEPDKTHPLSPSVPEFLSFAKFQPRKVELPLEAHWPAAQSFVLTDRLAAANREIEKARSAVEQAMQELESEPNEQKQLQLEVAKRRLAVAVLTSQQILTAFEADRAKVTNDPQATELAKIAAAVFAKIRLANAEHNQAATELEILNKPDDAKLGKKLKEAKETVASTRVALEKENDKYESIHVSLKALEGPDESDDSRRQPYPAVSTGRRLAFARWLTNSDNPLTARVAINHIWLRHFGQPLVESVADFGRRAKQPAQQDLLDWLAVEFMKNDWKMKQVHRMIVTSEAYQLSSVETQAVETNQTEDPNNEFYWRRIPVRMESQVIRDSLLKLAGQLDSQLGGPSIDANIDSVRFRRSLYFKHSRDDQHKLLSMFDDADIFRCYRRTESVVPQQALALANSRLALKMSQHIAERLSARLSTQPSQAASDGEFIEMAFETILCREPSKNEITACLQAIDQWRTLADAKADNDEHRSNLYRNLVHAVLNHNDFITIR